MMSRKTSLNEDRVFAAIHGLVAAGEYPTAQRIREQLGGIGSPVVLQRMLTAWYRRFGPALAAGEPSAAPPAHDGIRQQFEALSKEALDRLDRAHWRQAEALATREAELVAREQALQARAAALEPVLAELRSQTQAARGAYEAAIVELAETRARAAAQGERTEALAAKLAGMQADASELQVLRNERTYLREALEREQKRVLDLVAHRDEARRSLRAATSEVASLRGRLDEAYERATALGLQLAATRDQNARPR